MGRPQRRQQDRLPDAKTPAACDALLANAEKLLSEEAPEFLPAQQRLDFVKKNLTKAARQCRHAIESNPEGFDVTNAHRVLGRVLEKSGDAAGAAASFALADGRTTDVAAPGDAPEAATGVAEADGESAAEPDTSAPATASSSSKSQRKKKKKAKKADDEDEDEDEDEDALLAAAIAESAALREEEKAGAADEATDRARQPAAQADADAQAPAAVASATTTSGDGDGASTSGSRSSYRWADPLPDPERAEAFAAMGVQPGAPLTEADMIGVRACGGLSVVLATGLIVEAA